MSAATGHAVRINTNMQVLNYFNSKAKAFLEAGSQIVYLPISPNSDKMVWSPQELLPHREKAYEVGILNSRLQLT